MIAACAACGVAVAPGSRFCQGCGHPQPPPAAALLSARFASPLAYTPPHLADRILTSRSALEGEHKRVTVLFCDIVGSSGLADRLGSERMHELLGRFFDVALEEIHHYEGTLNQFLGDGFMALFGAPLALEHHEQQALLAALALRRRLEDPEAFSLPAGAVRVRIGLNTGLVVVGKIGDNLRMDYTAVGPTTNVAARLQAQAGTNEILLSSATWERVREIVRTESLGPIALRGQAEPVVAHRVIALRESGEGDAGAPTPFVARDRELMELREALEHAEAGRGQAIGVVGEPGMGKSRLIMEFRHILRDRAVPCLEGECLSYGTAIPYLPVLDLLRNGCRIVGTDTPGTMMDKVRTTLEDAGLDVPDTLPYLLHLLGLKDSAGSLDTLSPEAIRTRTVEALRRLLLRSSRRRALVLVIEDVHWIDQASELFLAETAEMVAAAPILLLVTHRPGYTPPWIRKSYATQIALRPLTDRDALALVRGLMNATDVPERDARALVDRGEGNPLFLEELVRTVGDDLDRAEAPTIPDTLLGVLTARIDRLSDDDKHLLQMAAVLGRDFPPGLLSTMLGAPPGLAQRLRQLVQLEFLHELTGGPEPRYAFKHALTRDAVYQGLLERKRQAAHGAAGRALEAQYAGRLDEVVEQLAYHFDLSDDGERAVDYLIRAAERGQRRWANEEAIVFFQRALGRLDGLPDTRGNRLRRIDAVTRQAEVLFALGRHRDHLVVLESIRSLVDEVADPERRAAWHYWTGFFHSLTGASPTVAIAHCRTASEVAAAAGLSAIQGYADTGLAQAYVMAGKLREAIEVGERALALFERTGDAWWASRALSQLSPAANHLGDWAGGLRYCKRALDLGRELDDLRLKVSGLIRTASTHIQRGDWEPGLRLCEEALGLGPTPFDAAAAHAIHGYGLVKAGQTPAGIAELADALTFYDRSHLRYTRSLFALWLADAHLRGNAPARARDLAREVLVAAREVGYRHLEGVAARLLGESLGGTDRVEAREHLAEAEHLLGSMGARNELGKVWVARACLDTSAPDRDLIEKAAALFQEIGTVDEPWRIERIVRGSMSGDE